jgi:murein DD-endopeptidase MepM/ murein hydrolase activator NlpD
MIRIHNLGVPGAGLLAALAVAACVGPAPPQEAAPPPVTPVVVAVLPGDTISAIARRNDVDWRELAAVNGLAPPYRIRAGQKLTLPLRLPPPVPVGAAVAAATPAGAPDPVATAPVVTLPEGHRTVVAESLPPPPSPPAPAGATAPALPLPPDPAGGAVLPASFGRVPLPPPWPETALEPEARLRAIAEAPPPPGAARWTRGSGRFAWPVRGEVVSTFGRKGGGLVNDGVNIAAPLGTPIRAAHAGTVVYVGNEVRGFGNLILIRDGSGLVTAYAHADAVAVRQGQSVREGQVIGRVGRTGAVATPQLHFQVRRDGQPVDPMRYLGGQVAGG